MTGAQLIDYLSRHDLNAEVCFIVANAENRVVYSFKEASYILDEESSIPALFVQVGEPIDLTGRRVPKPKFGLFNR